MNILLEFEVTWAATFTTAGFTSNIKVTGPLCGLFWVNLLASPEVLFPVCLSETVPQISYETAFFFTPSILSLVLSLVPRVPVVESEDGQLSRFSGKLSVPSLDLPSRLSLWIFGCFFFFSAGGDGIAVRQFNFLSFPPPPNGPLSICKPTPLNRRLRRLGSVI